MHPHRRLLRDRQGGRVRANFNLVAPLTWSRDPVTDTRTTDTSGQLDLFSAPAASGAVSRLIDRQHADLRPGDVDRANDGRTPATTLTPGTSGSTTATRTTTTSRTRTGPSPSADRNDAVFSYRALLAAHLSCREKKRSSRSCRAFEAELEANLGALLQTLNDGSYRPGTSICFIIRRPRVREVWAAPYRDRVPHHALYNRIAERFERAFIADTCACIPGRGTLYAVRRLEHKVRSITQNWQHPAWYLKVDLANFFVSIRKPALWQRLEARIPEPFWRALAHRILFHDPRTDVEIQGSPAQLALVPPAKSLFNQPADQGLPIGNLSSQFFANVYLDAVDQYAKHALRARHYIRYVDDIVLLDASPQRLNAWRAAIDAFLQRELGVRLNPAKTVLQPIARGIDFAGQVIKPWRTTIRRRTFNDALHRLEQMPEEDVAAAANSYLGMCRQADHSARDRARVANLVRRRGFAVDHQLTKVYA